MGLPRPKWYTLEDLAAEWECEPSLIEHYWQEMKILQPVFKFEYRDWRKETPTDSNGRTTYCQGELTEIYCKDEETFWATYHLTVGYQYVLKVQPYVQMGKVPIFLLEEVLRFEEEHGMTGNSKPRPPGKDGIGGKPPGAFTEAIEAAFRYFMENGNTEILKSGRRADFVKSLMSLVKNEDADGKGNVEISKYLSERIKGTKKSNGHPVIETQDRHITDGRKPIKIVPSEPYSMEKLSKILCTLRKKYSFPD